MIHSVQYVIISSPNCYTSDIHDELYLSELAAIVYEQVYVGTGRGGASWWLHALIDV